MAKLQTVADNIHLLNMNSYTMGTFNELFALRLAFIILYVLFFVKHFELAFDGGVVSYK